MKEKKIYLCMLVMFIMMISTISVGAATLMKSKDVIYDNSKSGIESTNVQEAVDELYSAATDYSSLASRVTALENENKFLNAHPVGSIYLTISEEENTIEKMHNLYGGEWEVYAEGRTLVGVGTGTDSNGTVKVFNKNESLGEYNHTITLNEMPSHKHIEQFPLAGIVTAGYPTIQSKTENTLRTSVYFQLSETYTSGEYYPITTDYKGADRAHNNIQPYTTVYMYKRVS